MTELTVSWLLLFFYKVDQFDVDLIKLGFFSKLITVGECLGSQQSDYLGQDFVEFDYFWSGRSCFSGSSVTHK